MEYGSGDEPFAFPVSFSGETAYEDNIVAVKINGTATEMLVDSGAQFTVLGERQFHSLVRSGLKAKLQPEERNLHVYGNGCLPVVGKFEATIECHRQKVTGTVLVTQGEGRCLLQPRTLIVGTLDTSRHYTPSPLTKLGNTASFAGKCVITNCFQLCEGVRGRFP